MPGREAVIDRATYIWPCINGICLRTMAMYFNNWTWDLLMVTEKHSLTGNCFLVGMNGKSFSCIDSVNQVYTPMDHPAY